MAFAGSGVAVSIKANATRESGQEDIEVRMKGCCKIPASPGVIPGKSAPVRDLTYSVTKPDVASTYARLREPGAVAASAKAG